MSYSTIWASSADQAFQNRIIASIASEGRDNPEQLLSSVLWHVCSASDVEAAYASALAAGNDNPGGDESVVTDAQILANVQPNLPAP